MAPDETLVFSEVEAIVVDPQGQIYMYEGVLTSFCVVIVAGLLAAWIKRFIVGRKGSVSPTLVDVQVPELTQVLGYERISARVQAPEQRRICSEAQRVVKREQKTNVGDTSQQREKSGEAQERVATREDQRFLQCRFASDEADRCIVRLARQGNPDEARKWLHRCMEAGCQPKQGTFTTLLHSYSRTGSIKETMEVVDEMRSAGLKFDTVTYNMIIDAWTRVGDACMAQLWMRRMIAEGVTPNVISFGIVFRACAAAGLLEDLQGWFSRSQAFCFDLGLASLDSTAKAIAKRNDAVSAMKWLRIAIEHGVQPRVDCFMEVLNSIVNKEDVELASDLIELMRAAHVQPDGTVLSRCVLMAASVGHVVKAQQWADECARRRCTLSASAKQSLLRAGLRIPEPGVTKLPQAVHARGGFEAAVRSANVSMHGNSDGSESVGDVMQATRRAANGKQFQGTIKDFQPGRFGHITCATTYHLFKKDVYIHSQSNPQLLTKGQRVSFVLHVDEKRGLPQALDIALISP